MNSTIVDFYWCDPNFPLDVELTWKEVPCVESAESYLRNFCAENNMIFCGMA